MTYTKKSILVAAAVLSASVTVGVGSSAAADEIDGVRLLMPIMNPANGRQLFLDKGCVSCHSVNGIGGEDAAALDVSTMDGMMGIYDLVAKMWSMAPVMIPAQEEELGGQIQLTGDELADIVAFLHDAGEQAKLTVDSLTPSQLERVNAMHEMDE